MRSAADRFLPEGRWPVKNPKDRLDELGNMVGAQLVPGVLMDELYGLAVEYRAEVERLRGEVNHLARLRWAEHGGELGDAPWQPPYPEAGELAPGP